MTGQAVERYPLPLRILHWLLALLLAAQLTLGYVAEHWATQSLSDSLLTIHFKLGITILCLMSLRLVLRLLLPLPAHVGYQPRWAGRLRTCVHALLYLLVILLPISGHIIWVWTGADRTLFGSLIVPAFFVPPQDETGRAIAWYVHVYGAWGLLALMGLHVGAAVFVQLKRGGGSIGGRMGFG